jgi:hypothetical protein
MLFGDRPQQRFLDEIVGSVCAPGESPGIAPKPWNFSLDETMKFGHFAPPLGPQIVGRHVRNLVVLCNPFMNQPIGFGKKL